MLLVDFLKESTSLFLSLFLHVVILCTFPFVFFVNFLILVCVCLFAFSRCLSVSLCVPICTCGLECPHTGLPCGHLAYGAVICTSVWRKLTAIIQPFRVKTSRNSSVGTVTRLQAIWPRSRSWSPSRVQNFHLSI
jgi:hypothetical protein